MIEVRNLTQVYRSGKGIFEVDFRVGDGEVFGYLGPNGAGKTTTIRNMMGFVNAKAGKVLIDGVDIRNCGRRIQGNIGYLPGEMSFPENMTGREFLNFMDRMRKTRNRELRETLLKRFELDVGGKIRKMSKGMKQKLGIVTAFMHDPKVLILDEPTVGLDPLMQNAFMELLNVERQRGKTVFMSSHNFEEVQTGCDRVGIIREGRLVSVEEVKSMSEMHNVSYLVTFSSTYEMERFLKAPFDMEVVKDRQLLVRVGYPYQYFFSVLSDCDVISMETQHESLEDVFMKYYGEGGGIHE